MHYNHSQMTSRMLHFFILLHPNNWCHTHTHTHIRCDSPVFIWLRVNSDSFSALLLLMNTSILIISVIRHRNCSPNLMSVCLWAHSPLLAFLWSCCVCAFDMSSETFVIIYFNKVVGCSEFKPMWWCCAFSI